MKILAEASREYAAERSQAAMDQLLVALMMGLEQDADVYSPGQIMDDDKQGMRVELGMMQASDGRWYGVICTDPSEVDKLPGAKCVTVKLKEMLIRTRATQGLGGLIVDPGNGANCFLQAGEIGILLDSLAKRMPDEKVN